LNQNEIVLKTRAFDWRRWISVFSALSFGMFGMDVLMNHIQVLGTNPFSLIPLICSPLLIALSLAAVFSAAWRRMAWIAGLLAVAVGLTGTLFHFVYNLADSGGLAIIEAVLSAKRPPFAPAAFAATGVLMLFVALSGRKIYSDG